MKLTLLAMAIVLAGCSLHVRPAPNVSVHIPVPAPFADEQQDHN